MQAQAIQGYQLSPQQKRLWTLEQKFSNKRLCAQIGVKLKGNLEIERIKTIIKEISQDVEILRTKFEQPAGMKFPLQVIAEEAKLGWEVVDFDNNQIEGTTDQFLNVKLIKLAEEEHLLLLTLPSLCADTTTLDLLVREMRDRYAGESVADSEERVQYLQVSEWQNELLAEVAENYWSKYQVKPQCYLKLPTQNLSVSGADSTSYQINVNQTQLENQEDIEGWLLGTWQVLLWRLTQKSELIINYASDGRSDEELTDTLGTLRKWLPLGVSLAGNLVFQEVIEQNQVNRREILEYQDEWNCNPDLDLNVGFEFYQWSSLPDANGVKFSLDRAFIEDNPHQLRLVIFKTENGFTLQFDYNQEQFNATDIERLAEEYLTLLDSSLSEPQKPISQLEIVGEKEREQLLVHWNQTQREFTGSKCLHERITEQAKANPSAIALRYQDQSLTYQQLNEQANQVAHYLLQQGVTSETLVGICLDRSLEAIISLLGILKAGAAYVPLDSGMPKQRLSLMLDDAPVVMILTRSQWLEKLPDEVTTVCLDQNWSKIAESPLTPLSKGGTVLVKPHHLAYVIFTSGSTGKPKGVAVEHRAIMNYVDGIIEQLQLPAGASYATVSALTADLGNTAVFGALCTGGTLNIFSQEQVSDPIAFTEYCQQYPIDCLKIVPSHLAVLLATGNATEILPRKQLILGGETTNWDLIRQVREIAPHCQIINHYGPTEATIGALTYRVEEEVSSGTVPIGRPLPNTEVYLLDSQLKPVPIGVTGEIYLGGKGLARGYYNQPELTEDRFIPHPFSPPSVLPTGGDVRGGLYKTGDIARYHPDGYLEFLGRVDQQVKIRGFRVELGEIEALLQDYPQVEEAVVALRTDDWNTPHLDAYVSPERLQGEEIRDFLRDRAPDYMIPDTFTALPALPRTASGKIDRQSLPEPNFGNENDEYIAPRNAIESAIAQIFCELLHLDQVSVTANFFDLGGHSLLATQVMARLRSTFSVEIPLRYLFESPTIAELSERITEELAQNSDIEDLLSELEASS
ncbi:MAG: amino acid adenylation domain-containing protein [Halothece sp.]